MHVLYIYVYVTCVEYVFICYVYIYILDTASQGEDGEDRAWADLLFRRRCDPHMNKYIYIYACTLYICIRYLFMYVFMYTLCMYITWPRRVKGRMERTKLGQICSSLVEMICIHIHIYVCIHCICIMFIHMVYIYNLATAVQGGWRGPSLGRSALPS